MEKNIPIFKDEVKTLTKKEYFAGLAMQGLCANYLRENITGWDVNTYAKESVELADALLKELNDQTENKYVDESTTEKENPLNRPSAHSLIDIFKELKFGRPIASQQFLDKCIARLKEDTLNFSEAIEALYDGKIVAEINWENEEGEKPVSYLKLLRTNVIDIEFNHNIINQPYIAKFTLNGGYMPHPYIPTSYEYMWGRFRILDSDDNHHEIESLKKKPAIDHNSQLPDFKFTPAPPPEDPFFKITGDITDSADVRNNVKTIHLIDDEVYGYILTNPIYERAALAIIGCDEFLNSDGVHVVRPENVDKLSKAGVLNDWFYPIFKKDINKFNSGKIDEMSSGGKCMVKYLKIKN